MIVKLLTEHHLEFLSLKGGCRDSSESTCVKMPHCWKSHALAQIVNNSQYWAPVCLMIHSDVYLSLISLILIASYYKNIDL